MKKPMTRSVGRLESIRTADQKLSVPVLLSFMGHVIFCILFIVLPKISFDTKKPSSFINVQLVSPDVLMPVQAPAPEQKVAVPEAATVVQPEAPTPKADVSTASKPKEAVSLAARDPEKKQSMKKKTFKRDRLMQSALENVEKRVEESKADPRQQALDRIRAELNEKDARADDAGSGTAPAGTSGLSRKGQPTTDIERIYIADVAMNIQKNWAFSDQLAGGEKDLYNEVVIEILRSGEIKDIWFDRRSGNRYLDDSTYKAILKSNPLPPIPEGISGSSLIRGFRFRPEGLK
jgi:colicin import membrane protein